MKNFNKFAVKNPFCFSETVSRGISLSKSGIV